MYRAVTLVVAAFFLSGCAATAGTLMASAIGFGTVGYAALPGNLEAEYRVEQPTTVPEQLAEVQHLVVAQPETYTGLHGSKHFSMVELVPAGTPRPRVNQEASALARKFGADAYVRAEFMPPQSIGGSEGFAFMRTVRGEYSVTIVSASNDVLYEQTVTLLQKESTLANESFTQKELRSHMVTAMLHDLKKNGFMVAGDGDADT